jgi:large subunit ribosomal protein L6
MSRIGKSPIPIPNGTQVTIKDNVVSVKGPKGELSQSLLEGFPVAIEDGQVVVSRSGESGPERSKHGLLRSLIANAVEGVTNGFTKVLEIIGVGYRAEVKEREIHFALGYSHPVIFPLPEGISAEIDKQNRITITGVDRQQVGQVAAEIRGLRRPDPYKGKGIRYAGETVRLKAGKAGA